MTVGELREILNDMDADIPILFYAPKEEEWRHGDMLHLTLDRDDTNLNAQGLGTITLFIND